MRTHAASHTPAGWAGVRSPPPADTKEATSYRFGARDEETPMRTTLTRWLATGSLLPGAGGGGDQATQTSSLTIQAQRHRW